MRLILNASYEAVNEKSCTLHTDTPPEHAAYLVYFPGSESAWVCGFDVSVEASSAIAPVARALEARKALISDVARVETLDVKPWP
jgi:hypothetical protein